MSKIIDEDEFNKVIKNLRAEGIEPFPFITPDFNFSAKFYAAWLRWLFANLQAIQVVINQLLKREIDTATTDSIQLSQDGDWTTEFVVTLKAILKISAHTDSKTLIDFKGVEKTFTLLNALKVYTDGVYSPDFTSLIDFLNGEVNNIQTEINDINNEITNINNEITNIKNEITNIINHLPSGNLSFTSKETIWQSNDGAMSGTATQEFTPGSYEIEWGGDSLGFSTSISIVVVQGNKNITYSPYNNSVNLAQGVYNCNIVIDSNNKKNWTAQIGVIESLGTGGNTTRTVANPKVGKISKLVDYKFNFGD